MLTMADKGGRGGLDPPFLADIIFEQPLTDRASDLGFTWRIFLQPEQVTETSAGGYYYSQSK